MEPNQRYETDDKMPFLPGAYQPNQYMESGYNQFPGGPPIDPKLSDFVNKYGVELSDGSVFLQDPKAKPPKKETNVLYPCGCTKIQFIIAILLIILAIAALIIGLSVGLTRSKRPNISFPPAKIWWKRSLIYQINIRTHANDVGGPIGRLEDVVSRIPYYYHQVGALALLFTDLVEMDNYGVKNFKIVDPIIDPETKGTNLLMRLKEKANKPDGPRSQEPSIQLLLGLPLYATSSSHEWFKQSVEMPGSKHGTYYIWRANAAYYRHTHGNKDQPLLNLEDVQVQMELDGIITHWKDVLGIKGIEITNSTSYNLIPEMVPFMRNILLKQETQDFVWFADDPETDEALANANLCFARILIKSRFQKRSEELSAQLAKYQASQRFKNGCVRVWRVAVEDEGNPDSNIDYQSIMGLAYFLPGIYNMMSGQEVLINDGNRVLMKWTDEDYLNYETYFPVNKVKTTSRQVLNKWVLLKNAIYRSSLLRSDPIDSPYSDLSNMVTSNDVSIYKRTYTQTDNAVIFMVSFSTLNIDGRLNSFLGPSAYVEFDSKNMYSHQILQLSVVKFTNNQIFLLFK
ncbi:hypothetical protein Ciccas_003314 [Cichlidogyrus casuarinus]|uniref:Glycosyl hydrolase family 13 catalytic domain-containing protein n=1 Tax=Cichlidogyrus casuarinus TaxID=1844966 RepID=A0ABD2QEP2_9PLAT